MSFKCSVFGHKFGDPVVDRDREEAGSEVVITIQETQTCSRCGEERIVSENKEVTTLETPGGAPVAGAGDEADADAAETTTPTAGRTDGPAPGTGEDAVTAASDSDSAEVISADESADSSVDDATDEADAGDAAGDADTGDAVGEMDDATIIEESPETSIVEEAEPDDGPEPPGVGSGTTDDDAGPDDDAVILEDDTADEDDDRKPGEWPEEPDDDDSAWSPPTDVGEQGGAADADDATPTVEPTGEAVTVPEGTFNCPACGFSTPVESSSLRAGDFCPECHTGSLVHEHDDEE